MHFPPMSALIIPLFDYNNSSMLASCRPRRPLPCLTEPSQIQKTLPDCVYGSFAFKDRMTNSQFNYSDAIHDQNISFGEWMPSRTFLAEKKLKDIVSTYRFTKKFQMKCIRDKYHLSQQSHKSVKQKNKERKTNRNTQENNSFSQNKSALFNRSKVELRRVLVSGDRVDPEVIKLGQRQEQSQKKIKRKGNKWMRKMDTPGQIALPIDGQRVYERAINHMNYQLRYKGEYLINLPQDAKRKNLINRQFRNQDKENSLPTPFLEQCYNQCQFEPIKPQFDIRNSIENEIDESEETKELFTKIRLGYINEVYEILTSNMSIVESRDPKGNNIFHMAAQQCNLRMLSCLFRTVPSQIAAELLKQKNKLGRTPAQKAQILGNKEAVGKIELYIKDSKKQKI